MKTKPTNTLEKFFWSQGFKHIAGVDEAGAGPLAGPVVAAAVVFGNDFNVETLADVNDSKRISSAGREELYSNILKSCLHYGVGLVEASEIDDTNIFQARFLAMKRALEHIPNVNAIIIDGPHTIADIKKPQFAVVDGDAKVFSVAVASIVAKVHRDNLMRELALQYPQYKFDQHMGYATKLHRELLLKYGPCPIHRLSFLTNIYETS